MAKRIVIADADAATRKQLAKLVSVFGYTEIDEAEDGLVALNKISQKAPELALLDASLPSLDGFLLCEILHKVVRFRDVSVALMANAISTEMMQQGLQAGAYAFLEKPPSPEGVKALVGGVRKETASLLSGLGTDFKEELNLISVIARQVFSLIFGDQAKILALEPIDQAAFKDTQDWVGTIAARGKRFEFELAFISSGAFTEKIATFLGVGENSARLRKAMERLMQLLMGRIVEEMENESLSPAALQVYEKSPLQLSLQGAGVYKIRLGIATHGAIVRKQFNIPLYVAIRRL